MGPNKEQILSPTCLKEVGYIGIGCQKVMTLACHMDDNDL